MAPRARSDPTRRTVLEDTSQTLGFRGFKATAGGVSQGGWYPSKPEHINQDRVLLCPRFGGSASSMLFGVFDGHGK